MAYSCLLHGSPESFAGQTIHFCLSVSCSMFKTAAFPCARGENGAAFDNLISYHGRLNDEKQTAPGEAALRLVRHQRMSMGEIPVGELRTRGEQGIVSSGTNSRCGNALNEWRPFRSLCLIQLWLDWSSNRSTLGAS